MGSLCIHAWVTCTVHYAMWNYTSVPPTFPLLTSKVYVVVALLLPQVTATWVIYWVNTRAGPLFCSPSPQHRLAVAILSPGGGSGLLKHSLRFLKQTQSGLPQSILCYYSGQSTSGDCELCVLGFEKTCQEGNVPPAFAHEHSGDISHRPFTSLKVALLNIHPLLTNLLMELSPS
jgi:hypothetical protein